MNSTPYKNISEIDGFLTGFDVLDHQIEEISGNDSRLPHIFLKIRIKNRRKQSKI